MSTAHSPARAGGIVHLSRGAVIDLSQIAKT